MAQRRETEAKLAAERLKLDSMIWLGLPEGDWAFDQLAAGLQPVLADFRPTLVYAPSRVDFHPEHHRVAYT
jgi:LmbE family N-acetylglucosaminyl deacetylase